MAHKDPHLKVARPELSADDKIFDTLHLSEDQRQRLFALLDDMDAQSSTADSHVQQRRHERIPFRDPVKFKFQIHQPGGNYINFLILTRNISASGLGFIHGGYVYLNSECFVELPTADGNLDWVSGRIMHCAPLSGRIHYVGMEFYNTIDVDAFL